MKLNRYSLKAFALLCASTALSLRTQAMESKDTFIEKDPIKKSLSNPYEKSFSEEVVLPIARKIENIFVETLQRDVAYSHYLFQKESEIDACTFKDPDIFSIPKVNDQKIFLVYQNHQRRQDGTLTFVFQMENTDQIKKTSGENIYDSIKSHLTDTEISIDSDTICMLLHTLNLLSLEIKPETLPKAINNLFKYFRGIDDILEADQDGKYKTYSLTSALNPLFSTHYNLRLIRKIFDQHPNTKQSSLSKLLLSLSPDISKLLSNNIHIDVTSKLSSLKRIAEELKESLTLLYSLEKHITESRDFTDKISVSISVKLRAFENLLGFSSYLQDSIRTQQNKNNIKLFWLSLAYEHLPSLKELPQHSINDQTLLFLSLFYQTFTHKELSPLLPHIDFEIDPLLAPSFHQTFTHWIEKLKTHLSQWDPSQKKEDQELSKIILAFPQLITWCRQKKIAFSINDLNPSQETDALEELKRNRNKALEALKSFEKIEAEIHTIDKRLEQQEQNPRNKSPFRLALMEKTIAKKKKPIENQREIALETLKSSFPNLMGYQEIDLKKAWDEERIKILEEMIEKRTKNPSPEILSLLEKLLENLTNQSL
jgi:hypothetical protein